MYSISVTVMTDNSDQRISAFMAMTDFSRELDQTYPSVVISSHEFQGNDVEYTDEYHDDYTLLKVVHALREAGISDEQAEAAINQMQNRGILFRERVS